MGCGALNMYLNSKGVVHANSFIEERVNIVEG